MTTGFRHEFSVLTQQEPSDINQIITTELLGPTLLARSVLPAMNAQQYGRLVFVGSDSGKAGTLGDAASSAARAGLMGLTGKVMQGTVKAILKGRAADPAEIAEAVAYFVGDQSGFTTGQTLSVSGGLTLS